MVNIGRLSGVGLRVRVGVTVGVRVRVGVAGGCVGARTHSVSMQNWFDAQSVSDNSRRFYKAQDAP